LIDWEFIWDGGIGGACSLEINSEAFCKVFSWKADVLDSQGAELESYSDIWFIFTILCSTCDAVLDLQIIASIRSTAPANTIF
jgi:hypothetical protein